MSGEIFWKLERKLIFVPDTQRKILSKHIFFSLVAPSPGFKFTSNTFMRQRFDYATYKVRLTVFTKSRHNCGRIKRVTIKKRRASLSIFFFSLKVVKNYSRSFARDHLKGKNFNATVTSKYLLSFVIQRNIVSLFILLKTVGPKKVKKKQFFDSAISKQRISFVNL